MLIISLLCVVCGAVCVDVVDLKNKKLAYLLVVRRYMGCYWKCGKNIKKDRIIKMAEFVVDEYGYIVIALSIATRY